MRDEILRYLTTLLSPERVQDYAPNGLQVEGRRIIKTLVTGVTASRALIEAALAANADAILVHHGYFWRGDSPAVIGMLRERLALLLKHDVNLFAYHLPLDLHATLGNNACLGKQLGFSDAVQHDALGVPGLLWAGKTNQSYSAKMFSAHLAQTLGREPLCIVGEPDRLISRVAWCTGAAEDAIVVAARLGVDAYLSGEVSERTVHQARELGVHFYACGHHATERGGVIAVGEQLAEAFDITHRFIDIPNPV